MFKEFIFIISLLFVFSISANAQSGAQFSMGTFYSTAKDPAVTQITSGYSIKLDARMGSKVIYFNPGLQYTNSGILASDKIQPFADNARVHKIQAPIGLGLKFRFFKKYRIWIGAGALPSYVLLIDDNPKYDFANYADTNVDYYGKVGIDFNYLTFEYSYATGKPSKADLPFADLITHAVGIGVNF